MIQRQKTKRRRRAVGRGYRTVSPWRHSSGATLAEFAAALILMIPLLIVVCFISVESMMVCMIKSILNYSASVASRDLAIEYGTNPVGAMSNPDSIFSNIRFMSVVVSNDQFSIPEGAAGWSTTSSPPTVTVEVTFKGGQFGLPDFPNPDPLALGPDFSLSSTATMILE